MAKKIVLKVDHVSMRFNLSKEKVDSLKDYILKFVKRELHFHEFLALDDINFELEAGDRLGILGFNGAGKSTLLKAIAGVLKPTVGKVKTKGRVVPLLELGAGFDPQYTGAENIFPESYLTTETYLNTKKETFPLRTLDSLKWVV